MVQGRGEGVGEGAGNHQELRGPGLEGNGLQHNQQALLNCAEPKVGLDVLSTVLLPCQLSSQHQEAVSPPHVRAGHLNLFPGGKGQKGELGR